MIEAIGSFSALRDNDLVGARNDVRTSPLVSIHPVVVLPGWHAITIATVRDDLKAVVTAEGRG